MPMAVTHENLHGLAGRRIGAGQKAIKLIVSDIEGCLNLDEKTYDYEALSWIRCANELARCDNAIPFITVASGRQHAFVEAIVRMINGSLPAVFENGCGLFFPMRSLYDEYEWHPMLDEENVSSEYATVRQVIAQVSASTGARRVIGKEVLISLHPLLPTRVAELRSLVETALGEAGVCAMVTNSASAVDIAPCGIDKAAGLRWLITKLGPEYDIDLFNVCGIGDSRGDLSMLNIVGLPAAPGNAAPEVRDAVAYCSTSPDGKGVVSIIEKCISINSENN